MNPGQPQHEPAASRPANHPLANGPAAAAILSAGIGCFALGVFAVIADASKSVGRFFTFYLPTGPLSGVTTTAILLWLVLCSCWHAYGATRPLPLPK